MVERRESKDTTGGPLDPGAARFDRATLLRRAAFAASGFVTVPALAGCMGSGDDDSASGGKVTLNFWKFVDEPGDPVIQKAIKEWNGANPNVQVKLQTFPFEDYITTTLTTGFAGGRGPDVFWASAGTIVEHVNEKVTAPVNDLIAGHEDEFLQVALDDMTVDGDLMAIPFELTPIGLYYRKDSLEAAGVEPPTTWPELLAAAEQLTTDKQSGVVVEPASSAYQVFTWTPFLWMTGAEVMDAEWNSSALRTPEAASAFDLWGQLIARKYAPRKLAAGSNDIGPLGRGETAMQVCGYWAKAQLAADFADVDYGVVALPAPPGRESVSVGGGWMQAVNANGDHVEAAKSFTKWMWFESDWFAREWACGPNTQFSTREAVNKACKSARSEPVDDFFRDKILPTARPEARYPAQISKALQDGLQAAMFGGRSGEEAANLAADAVDAFLANYDGVAIGQ